MRDARIAVLSLGWMPLLWLSQAAWGAQLLREVEGLPFAVAVQSKLEAKLLPQADPAAMAAALVLPRDISSLDVLEVRWAHGHSLQFAIGRTGSQPRGKPEQTYSTLACRLDDKPAQLVDSNRRPLAGTVNRICVWQSPAEDELHVLYSMAGAGTLDSPIQAFGITTAGILRNISTSGALSAYGGFEIIDLDGDGSFELVTTRNLDGMPGGFSYHAVRKLIGNEYAPAPEGYKAYFRDELVFLNWVVTTRDLIQANPEQYVDKGLYGFFYAAAYQGQLFGFDSIVELPVNAGAKVDRTAYNQQRREAFTRVSTYRDELQRWLDGGPRPATWKLAQ